MPFFILKAPLIWTMSCHSYCPILFFSCHPLLKKWDISSLKPSLKGIWSHHPIRPTSHKGHPHSRAHCICNGACRHHGGEAQYRHIGEAAIQQPQFGHWKASFEIYVKQWILWYRDLFLKSWRVRYVWCRMISHHFPPANCPLPLMTCGDKKKKTIGHSVAFGDFGVGKSGQVAVRPSWKWHALRSWKSQVASPQILAYTNF